MGTSAEEPGTPLFPLRRIEVTGLFGSQNVGLDLDPAATILTGENGSGKSTILKAVDYVGNRDWQAFRELPLDSVRMVFEAGYELNAEGRDDAVLLSDNGGHEDQIDLTEGVGALQRELEFARFRLRNAATPSERSQWRVAADRLQRRLRVMQTEEEAGEQAWVRATCARIHTKLISARRLEHSLANDEIADEEGRRSVVDVFAAALADRMKTSLSAYATESRQQEKVLPSQIVRAMLDGPEKSEEELARDVDSLRAQVRILADSLTRVGLFQDEDPDPQFMEYPRDNPSILLAIREVYRVALLRLQRLTSLRADLERFEAFLNDRLTGKTIQLSQRSGIEVVLDTGPMIRPSQLSSGEQQLLAVAYELLFQTPENSVVLLDEPELSLHVAWLQGLMSALLGMGESRGLQFILATHSSSLLAGFQGLERSLDEDLRW